MFTEFFKGRSIRGFYLPIVGAILSLAASIIYITGKLSSAREG